MLSQPWLVLALLGAVSASPIAKPVRRWTQNVATCRSFYADIYAEASNVDLASVIGGTYVSFLTRLFRENDSLTAHNSPTNQQVLVQSEVDEFAAGSTVMKQIMEAPKIDVSGNYEFYFEYCEPVDGNVKGVFQTHHGIVANAGYWNVELE